MAMRSQFLLTLAVGMIVISFMWSASPGAGSEVEVADHLIEVATTAGASSEFVNQVLQAPERSRVVVQETMQDM